MLWWVIGYSMVAVILLFLGIKYGECEGGEKAILFMSCVMWWLMLPTGVLFILCLKLYEFLEDLAIK